MSKVVTEETLYSIMNSYEARLNRLEADASSPRTTGLEFAPQGGPADVRLARTSAGHLGVQKADGTAGVITFGSTGVAPPGAGSTAGWKIKLYGDDGYGFGIDSGTLWYKADQNHRFYNNTNTLQFQIDVDGVLRSKSNVWHLDTDGYARLLYGGNSHTYFRTRDGFAWRNSGDADIFFINNSGAIRFATGQWFTDAQNNERMHFGNGWATYFRAPNGGFIFRNSGATDVVTIDNGGNFGSVAQVSAARLYGSRTTGGSRDWPNAQIEARGGDFPYDPRIAFHIPGRSAPQLTGFADNTIGSVSDGGGAWVPLQCSVIYQNSDVANKRDLEPMDPDVALTKLKGMKINKYKRKPIKVMGKLEEDTPSAIGPTAQDFHAAFPGLGGNNSGYNPDAAPDDPASDIKLSPMISVADQIGVCMAAIQALGIKVDELNTRLPPKPVPA